VASKFARFESNWLHTVCEDYCKRRCTKHVSPTLTNWNSDWEQSEAVRPKAVLSSLQKPFVSSVVDISRAVMRVLYTFSCNISHMLLSTAFKSGEFGGHSWGWINSGVSFCNSSTVAYAQWAFQVSQGSLETLFRWGGRRLHHFELNLFGKQCTKFRQNR